MVSIEKTIRIVAMSALTVFLLGLMGEKSFLLAAALTIMTVTYALMAWFVIMAENLQHEQKKE